MLTSVKTSIKGTFSKGGPVIPRIGLEKHSMNMHAVYYRSKAGEALNLKDKEFSWHGVHNVINDHLRRIPHETS